MKALFIAMAFVAVVYVAGLISDGNTAVQLATLLLSGFVLVWYVFRAICCACSQSDKPSCSKPRADR
jgi:membrane protein implicated in regulation of membrane protease activity